jgi:RNA polymerase sigma factor (sigma-70 family)
MPNQFLDRLRRNALVRDGGGLTDGQLLGCFIERRDEAAFEALVRRHGPMVLGVCRRLLGSVHDAEDAFQATFLVLARKAASLRSRELVGNWLYGAAYRTAMQARATIARRQAREKQVQEMPDPQVEPEPEWRELLPLLDRELNGLPDKYRVPVVLCDLEGKSRKEVARRLGLPEGTLSWRLAHARRLLAGRLARYGLAVSGGALAAALSEKAASAAVTGTLAASTARAAVLVAAGEALTAGTVPARVVALTEGVVKTMFLMKLRAVVALALVVCVGAGVAGLAYQTGAAEPGKAAGGPAAAGPVAADDLEALRLEVEALRKSLDATRKRVQALEDEVRASRERDTAAPKNNGSPAKSPTEGGYERAVKQWYEAAFTETAADPLAEAEAALQKLRADPNDKQAADALEKALGRLKERRAKPEGQTGNPEKKP